ncbi:beta-xylosidase 3 [Striga asiatica]|uniref:Beta-xylosidase 3 n=1 Tax=Striga asiatica TaxID=4170 RepID=A0A5A7P636_STRAF|nr:beta-xylosidase 3 [Striga asiatica]
MPDRVSWKFNNLQRLRRLEVFLGYVSEEGKPWRRRSYKNFHVCTCDNATLANDVIISKSGSNSTVSSVGDNAKSSDLTPISRKRLAIDFNDEVIIEGVAHSQQSCTAKNAKVKIEK